MELEGPEWLDGENARDDSEAGQERGLTVDRHIMTGEHFVPVPLYSAFRTEVQAADS